MLKFILVVFVPVVLASILTNVGKTKAIIDFLYYVFVWPMLQSKSLIPMLAEKFSMEQYMVFFLLACVYGLYCCGWLALFSISYIKIRAKIRLTSLELNYKSLNDTYFLPAIFFAEFVVVVYVGIFLLAEHRKTELLIQEQDIIPIAVGIDPGGSCCEGFWF